MFCRMKKYLYILLSALLAFGCVKDDKDVYSRQIRIDSNPQGASVIIDGFKLGKTPIEVGVETTEDGCFVKKTAITLIPASEKNFTQVETFPGYRKAAPEESVVPERIFFDLTKDPKKEKTTLIEY